MTGAPLPENNPVDNAWKMHAALTDWTAKVDNKATFALAIESAVLAGIVNASRDNALLGHLQTNVELGWYRLGITVLVLAVLCVMSVVAPRLRIWGVRNEWQRNYIYFGHVRYWDEADLTETLKRGDILPVLSRQLINMSRIACGKHVRLQLSLMAAVIGTGCIGIAAWLKA